MSLIELCRRTGISHYQTLRRFESGERKLSLHTALSIDQALGVTVEELARLPHNSAPPRERVVVAGFDEPI